jgi:hypothetical protein
MSHVYRTCTHKSLFIEIPKAALDVIASAVVLIFIGIESATFSKMAVNESMVTLLSLF